MTLNIITGEINSGKTSYLNKLALSKGNCFGWKCPKVYDSADNFVGYNLETLCEKQTIDFIKKTDHKGWYEFSGYYFNKLGFDLADKEFNVGLSRKLTNFFIDEVGPLELSGGGFYEIFIEAIKTDLNVFVVIRTSLIKQVVEKFNIKNFQILNRT